MLAISHRMLSLSVDRYLNHYCYLGIYTCKKRGVYENRPFDGCENDAGDNANS